MPRPFDEFVSSRGGVLWRTAWLLTGDAGAAERLLGTALARVEADARRGGGSPAGLDDEALAALVRAFLPRRGKADRPPGPTDWEPAARSGWTADDEATIEQRHRLLTGLGLLTPRQRAVVVLLHAERRSLPEAAALAGVRTEVAAALHAEACARLRGAGLLARPGTPPATGPVDGLDADEEHRLRAELGSGVPTPPYAPTRAADAAARAGRARRRTLVAVAVAVVLLLAPLVQAGLRGPDDPAPPPRRLVEGPVPHRCADVPPVAPVPDLPLDLDQASVAWLRFCGPAFVPDTAVVGGLDGLVASWVSRPGFVSCPQLRPVDDGATRLELGTQDGQLHVVDVVLGECGAVEVDGQPMAVSGRSVFAQAVGALGRQLLGDVHGSAPPAPAAPRCPTDPMDPQTVTRRAVPDYPSTDGLALPLPAVGALICRYDPARGDAPPRLVESFPVGPDEAEQIRAAYLAYGRRAHPPCVDDPGPLFAAVVVDATESWHGVGFDTGACDALAGPGVQGGTAGHWLVETVRYAVPPRRD